MNRPRVPRPLALSVLLTAALLALVWAATQVPSRAQGAVSPWPRTPPDASKITVSAAEADGYATVSGAAGAVPPSAQVLVLNQSATNVVSTTADVSGAFTTSLYAPTGSWLLVKYDPQGRILDRVWERAASSDRETVFASQQSLQNLPGVILRAGELPDGGDGWQEFAEVGHLGWWVGWAMEGTLYAPSTRGLRVLPGDTLTLTAQVTLHAPALACSGTPTVTLYGGFSLLSLFAGSGRAVPWGTWFASHLFTPTGLPIDHEALTEAESLGDFTYTHLTCLSPGTFRADAQVTVTVPSDLAEGIYRLQVWVLADGVPQDATVPCLPVWNHEGFEGALLPSFQVGDAAAPHIPWYMLLNEPVDGNRGVVAVEDRANFALPNRVRTEPSVLVIPRLDERTGQPIPYRLEPGNYWISGNDRRTPNPPHIPLLLPSGRLSAVIAKPDGTQETVGPFPIAQTDIRTPCLEDGNDLDEGTGNMCDVYHLSTMRDEFAYTFDQDGWHTIVLSGTVDDIYGNAYEVRGTFEVMVARVLDLDPGQLPHTPYQQGDAFAPGMHVFPPLPAQVEILVTHLPDSDPALAITRTIRGQANPYGYFQPPAGTAIRFDAPGEFRVDVTAHYLSDSGLWAGATTWGGVVEGPNPRMEAHGRRGLSFPGDSLDDTPAWFITADLPAEKWGVEHWVPYFSGDIAWGAEPLAEIEADTSLHSIVTVRDLSGPSEQVYDVIRTYYDRCRDPFGPPPVDDTTVGLEKRLAVGEAPLSIATHSGVDPEAYPDQVEYWGYGYAASERPDVHVREIIAEDGIATAYWRFNDTYGYQIGEAADGDQVGDIKWNFGGAVMRVVSETHAFNEYAVYGSFWVLLPLDDPIGPRVSPPFQDATGASLNGGPILTLLGEDIDMLFLPKGVRPGDVLHVGDVIAFGGHVGPPLDSRVAVTLTSPSGVEHKGTWHANKLGWLYDPTFDFTADEAGRWTVDVTVEHDRPYAPTGATPLSHNTGTVLGTAGRYEFYVVEPSAPDLYIAAPSPGFIVWSQGKVEPIPMRGRAPAGTTAVHYTIHDKGVVMGQGILTPNAGGEFTLIYDAETLHDDFPMLSLTAREGRWEGLADEVNITFLAEGAGAPQAAAVTLIGEEVFVHGGEPPAASNVIFLPMVHKR